MYCSAKHGPVQGGWLPGDLREIIGNVFCLPLGFLQIKASRIVPLQKRMTFTR